MTADPQMTDIALDSVLAASPDPIVPADLASRVTAQATSERQRRMRGPFKARRIRRANGVRRARRPVVLGTIGGGLLAASAVAAAWVSDGPFDLAYLTKPVIELFVPEAPVETASVERPVAAPPRVAATASTDGGEAVADSAPIAARPSWNARQLRRAFAVRELLARRNPGQDPALSGIPRPRLAQRQAPQAARAQRSNALTPAQRVRIFARTQSPTPILRERLETLRERRNQGAPIVPDRIGEPQRSRVANALRNRLASEPALRSPVAAPSGSLDLSGPTLPPAGPAAIPQDLSVAPSGSLPPMILDNGPPGPEPVQLPDIRPDLSTGDIPATANARRAAMLERLRATQAAQRARAAAQRRTAPPRRPRIPRRPR